MKTMKNAMRLLAVCLLMSGAAHALGNDDVMVLRDRLIFKVPIVASDQLANGWCIVEDDHSVNVCSKDRVVYSIEKKDLVTFAISPNRAFVAISQNYQDVVIISTIAPVDSCVFSLDFTDEQVVSLEFSEDSRKFYFYIDKDIHPASRYPYPTAIFDTQTWQRLDQDCCDACCSDDCYSMGDSNGAAPGSDDDDGPLDFEIVMQYV